MAIQFGYRLALIAFATATLRGALTGAEFEGTLNAALLAGAAFFLLGLICGELARRVVEEQVESEFEQWLSAPADTRAAESTAPVQKQTT